MFSIFQKVLSDALGAHVEVTEFAAPGRCQKHPCDSNPCHNGGVCSRESGESASYSCLCKPGWSGNHCELDVNECEGGNCQPINTSLQDFGIIKKFLKVLHFN